MLKYSDFKNVDEFKAYYGIVDHKVNESATGSQDISEKRIKTKPAKVHTRKIQDDNYKVIYADTKPKEYKNIFKHIIIFTNDRRPENNKTLKNIIDAIDNLKKQERDIIPKLHVFVAAKIDVDEEERNITISDDVETFSLSEESNIDTLIFSRLGVQDEEQCEHIVKVLQDRGFLVLNPVQYSALACDKYQSAILFEKGEIPQPNFCLMTKDILYDENAYNEAMQKVYSGWDAKDSSKNEDFKFVVKILDGHGGTGVAMISGKEILAFLQMIFAIDPERKLIIQSKEEADGGDIRVHVLTLRDKQVILAAMKRVKISGDFRSNVSLGASAEPVELTPEQEQIALRTAMLSKLPWCAVDIMPLVKGSNKEVGDNVVLEINASPGTAGISEVIGENFINILLNELTDPNIFMLQDKIAGFIESVTVKFGDGIERKLLAKLDTGNSAKASTIEVGDYEEDDDYIYIKVDDKKVKLKKIDTSLVRAGESLYRRDVVMIPEIVLGLRKIENVKCGIVKSRQHKSTNVLLNRDVLTGLGYVVHPYNSHILTPEMEKVKIV